MARADKLSVIIPMGVWGDRLTLSAHGGMHPGMTDGCFFEKTKKLSEG